MKSKVATFGKKVLCMQTFLQMCGNRELYLENCRCIIEYHDIRIVVETDEFRMEIWGNNLLTDSRSPDCLLITGEIQTIQFIPLGVYDEKL